MAKSKAKSKTKRGGSSLLQRAVSSLASALTRVAQRDGGKKAAQSAAPSRKGGGKGKSGNGKERPVKPTTDIPIDIIERSYTPTQTGTKAGFRATGADQSRDQEYAGGYADNERFKDEDRYTNKSGDPRIGTHGRAYEPGEKTK